jgi:excisionase family DNA binding protein
VSIHIESRIAPSDLSSEQLKNLVRMFEGGARPALIDAQDRRTELPKAFGDFVAVVVEAMKHAEAVFILHENEALTTQAAANYLGVSRQHVVQLLESGKIRFHRVGTHRRVLFKDLLEFQEERSRSRQASLDRMTEELVTAGVYDRYVSLERDDSER